MGRVFFPTQNNLGVRDTSQSRTLGGAADYSTFRAPAEAAPHPAMNPVTLGIVSAREILSDGWAPRPPIRIVSDPIIVRSVSSDPAAPPVSTQNSPTPQVSAPPPSILPTPIIVTSGGGTVSPATATTSPIVVAPASGAPAVIVTGAGSVPAAAPVSSSGVMGDIANWLGGSTTLFGYAVPNAILAGAVALGFAWLSAPSTKGRR